MTLIERIQEKIQKQQDLWKKFHDTKAKTGATIEERQESIRECDQIYKEIQATKQEVDELYNELNRRQQNTVLRGK